MPGRHTVIRTTIHLALAAALSAGVAAAQAATSKPVPPELPAETLASGGTLAAASTERIYVADVMIFNIVDGRLRVFDARAGKLLGMVNTGYAGNFALSAKADALFVATTYLSRGGRGDRTDVLEVWDTQTLGFKYEVVLPPKRAQTLNYRGMVSVTGNGRFVLVQNATPATSITVVDLAEKKVATEVQTPGCWGSWPASSGARFSMLCGDGKVATVTLDDQGQVADRQLSDKLFDADQDAWFNTAERIGDRFFFISFKGTLTELDLSGPAAKVLGSRPIAGTPQDAKRRTPSAAGARAATRPLPCTPAARWRWCPCMRAAAKAATSCRPSNCGWWTWPPARSWRPTLATTPHRSPSARAASGCRRSTA